MENIIIPIITLLIGWMISEVSKRSDYKRQDKKKLKRLLYKLLDFRNNLTRLFNMDRRIQTLNKLYFERVEEIFGENVDINSRILLKEIMKSTIKETGIFNEENIFSSKENIEKTIDELSEINPFLAYGLNLHDNIKASLEYHNAYFEKIENMNNEEIPLEIKEKLSPHIEAEILKELDIGLVEVALMISKKAKKEVEEVIDFQNDFTYSEEELISTIDKIIYTLTDSNEDQKSE